MTSIAAISGSLRKASYNTALLRAANGLLLSDCSLELHTLHGVPLYDGDEESENGVPESVERLKDAIADADALLIATPEYNNLMPGVLKNALDWISRPPKDMARVLRGRPLGIVGATPSGMGTVLAQAAWLPVARSLGLRLFSGGLMYVSGASRVFNDSGELVDDQIRERLQQYLQNFVAFVREQ